MKKIALLSKFLVLLFLASVTAMGQYTGSNPNVAVDKSVLATDSTVGLEPRLAVDDNELTFASIPGAAPAWIRVDLGGGYIVDGDEIVLPTASVTPLSFTFEVSANGSAWTVAGGDVISSAGTHSYDVVPTETMVYARINMAAKDDPAQFAEIRVFGEVVPPPYAALALSASSVGETGFTANWEENEDAEGYAIQVAYDENYSDRVTGYHNLDVGDNLNYPVTGLSPGQNYYYRVRCYNYAGTSGFGNTIEVYVGKEAQDISFGELDSMIYGDAALELTATASSGLPVSFESSDESIATVSGTTLTIAGAGSVDITATQEGDAQYNAADPVVQSLVVGTKELTVVGAAAVNKVYDSNTDAAINGASLDGVVGTDAVSLTQAATGTFAQAGVGTAIAVSTDMGLGGADADNYTLPQQPAGLQADITARELTVSGIVVANKQYDGNTDASISGATLDGVVGSEDVTLEGATTGTFAQKDVGTDIAVSTAMTIGGADVANYTFVGPTGLMANITLVALVITADDKTREACVENPEFTFSYTGFIDGEDASSLDSEPDVSCAAGIDSPGGTYDIVVSGGSSANYGLSYVKGTLTVNPDEIAPVLQVKNISVTLNENDYAEITPEDVIVEASDNCSIVETILSKSTFGKNDIGDVSVVVLVKDAANNSANEIAVVTVIGANSIELESGLKARIYPNPTSGRLNLELGIAVEELKVMDITGKVIINKAFPEMNETIDLSEHNNGIYLIQLRSGDNVSFQKVIKK